MMFDDVAELLSVFFSLLRLFCLSQTQSKREKHDRLKDKRRQVLAARLEKVKQRRIVKDVELDIDLDPMAVEGHVVCIFCIICRCVKFILCIVILLLQVVKVMFYCFSC